MSFLAGHFEVLSLIALAIVIGVAGWYYLSPELGWDHESNVKCLGRWEPKLFCALCFLGSILLGLAISDQWMVGFGMACFLQDLFDLVRTLPPRKTKGQA